MLHWNRINRSLGVIALLLAPLAGCSADRDDVSSPVAGDAFVPSVVATTGFIEQEVTINNYIVRFDGRTVSGGNTTFTYTVRGTGVGSSMSHFTVELPSCAGAPVSFSPAGSGNINTNPQTGIYGVEWHLSVQNNNLVGQTYSVTFPGDVKLGIVRSEVKTEGGNRGVGNVFGPCAGFHISGSVFVDADNNGLVGASEAGIAGVTVAISDGVSTQSAITSPTGRYEFVVATGTYTVSIPATTAASDLNEDLYASSKAVTATSLTVTVGPDASNTNFAFEPESGKVVADLESGVLITGGKTVRFWKTQLKIAQTGRSGGAYTAAQILSWLQQVEQLGIETPFQFGTGTEFGDAFAILSDNTRSDVVTLQRELLTSELNFLSGNGLVGQEDLHELLILWGEELVAQSLAPPTSQYTPMAVKEPTEAQSAAAMFRLLNGSTGGGGTDE